jgi:endoglucanase
MRAASPGTRGRHLLVMIATMFAAGCGPAIDEAAWRDYLDRFVADDGRVIDTGNDDVSHSEGQGWGMLLATAHQDRAAFDRIWDWTRDHLEVRGDHLFAWRWQPDADDPVSDLNNATDGDLYIAWALLRAGDLWGEPRYMAAALAILADVRSLLVREYAGFTVLLPGSTGFEHEDHLLLNLSYWIFPALGHFAAADPSPVWERLTHSGHALLAQGRFGRWKLPPDWLALGAGGQLEPAAQFPPRFGFDAVRIPLALHWSGQRDPRQLQPFARLVAHYPAAGCIPAWVNLDDDSVAGDPANPGMRAVLALAADGRGPPAARRLPPDADYYAASLLMLARTAALEIRDL